MSKILFFSEAEKVIMRENYADSTAGQLALKLERNVHSVKRFLKVDGLVGKCKRRIWTDEKLEAIRALYATTTNEELAKIFGVSESSIGAAGFKYNMVKSEEHIKRCKKGKFPKGHKTWNTGMKGLKIEGSEKGWFKKGRLPHNTKHDGCESVRTDSEGRQYLMVRQRLREWAFKHVLVWEEANGKLPDGMVIRHINGDSLDNRLENLKAISRAENMLQNSILQYPEELQKDIRALGQLKKTIIKHGTY